MGQSLSVRWFTKFCGILGITGLAGSASAARLEIARLFAPPDLSGPTLRAPQFSPDGRYLAYLKGRPDNKDRLDLWAFDIRAHRHVRLVDSASLAPQPAVLAAEEAQRRERQRLSALSGIIEYRFSPDSRYLLVPLEGDLYLYDLQAAPGAAVRRLTNTPAYETDARFSPKGHFVSYVREQNLYVYDLAAHEERAITHGGGGPVSYGVAEFVAQEEMERYT
ncbi:MAG TPA: DPP IV N-terminal domain-containing protein, partial [Steroidobacteraceae bacterium]